MISNIPLLHHSCPSQVCWFYDKRGVYSVKSGYQMALHFNLQQSPSSSSSSQAWWNIIWFPSISPKIRIFYVESFIRSDIHPINLFKRKIIQSPICQKIQHSVEDNFSTLVGCTIVKKVWRSLIFANSMNNYQSTNLSFFAQTLVGSMS